MKTRYQLTFEMFDTVEAAKRFCDVENRKTTAYMRKNHPAHVAPWTGNNLDGTVDRKFLAWYHRAY